MRIGLAGLGLVLALALSAGKATAADHPDAARAETLYNEALALADAGKYAEACPRYAESQRLDPALGTQFNLADCYEHVDRLANALLGFTSVERAARAAGKANLANKARDRAAKLEPKVPKLKVVLAAATNDATIKIDGVRVVDDALPLIPVDPGEHVVEVSAPGRLPFSRSVATRAGVTTVDVPPLAAAEAASAPSVTAAPSREPPATRPSMTWRVTGAALGGVGVIGLVIGGISGASAISKRDDAEAQCGNEDPKQCHSQAGVATWADAQSAGNLSTIAFVAGGALVAAGAIVWVLAPSLPAVTGRVDSRGGTIGLAGAF